MGMTMTQKILAKHAGLDSVTAGQLIEANVDLTLANDITGPVAIREMEKAGFSKVFDNTKIALVMDHFAPNKDIKSAEQCLECREFSKKYNIVNFFDVGAMGIEHALLPEKGLTAPGELIIGADSHTCTYGALGAFSTGVGSTDLAAGMATGKAWFKVPSAIKFVLTGKLSPWVSGKDVILHIIGKIGVDGALYQSMEFAGEGVHELSMDDRFTICNMAIEAGAKNGIFPVDDKTMDYIKGRVDRNITAFEADADAEYERGHRNRPVRAAPDRCVPAPPGEHQDHRRARPYRRSSSRSSAPAPTAVLMTCAVAAEILKGRKVAIRMCAAIIIPATQDDLSPVHARRVCSRSSLRQALSFPRRPAVRALAVIWAFWRTANGRSPPPTAILSAVWAISTSEVYLASPGCCRSKRSCRLHLCAGRPEVREETHTMNRKRQGFQVRRQCRYRRYHPGTLSEYCRPRRSCATHCNGGHRRGFCKEVCTPGDIMVADTQLRLRLLP